MKSGNGLVVWKAILTGTGLVVFVAANILIYGLILALIGAVISFASTRLTESVNAAIAATNSQSAPPSSAELIGALGPLDDGYLSVLGVLAVCLLTAFALRWFEPIKPTRAKIDAAVEKSIEWIIKLAELILLAVVFMLAAKKIPAWPVQLFYLLVFGCLAFHVIKPIAGLLTGPAMSAMGKKQSVAAVGGVMLLMFAASYLIWTILVLLSIGLNGLLESGISG